MISPGLPLLAMQFQKSLDVVSTYLVGLFILWTGIFTFFTSAAASVWGKRVMFITSGIALLALNAWGFFAKVSHLQSSHKKHSICALVLLPSKTDIQLASPFHNSSPCVSCRDSPRRRSKRSSHRRCRISSSYTSEGKRWLCGSS